MIAHINFYRSWRKYKPQGNEGFVVMLIRGPFRHFSQIITIFWLVLYGCETNGTSLVMIVATVETALTLSVW